MCGAADLRCLVRTHCIGLSPRVRGSRLPPLAPFNIARSIPTCAGQPEWLWVCRTACWVYPHVCGAAGLMRRDVKTLTGLSPRVRGSLIIQQRALRWLRSIPTCAGQPNRQPVSTFLTRVYPHVCGAAIDAPNANRIFPGLSPRVRGSPA